MAMFLWIVFVQLIGVLHAADTAAGDINIVVATKVDDQSSELYRINMSSQAVNLIPAFKLVRPTAVALDDVTQRIYWSDVVTKEIRTTRLDGSDERNFINLNRESIADGVAIDSTARLLFYTDRGNKVISSVSMDDARSSEVIVDEIDSMPRAITVYPEKKLLFWTDWGVRAHIQSCSYDCEEKEILISKKIIWPNGLTIDTASETIYWCDAFDGLIESADIDGMNRKLITKTGAHYYGIAFFEGALYTTDWDFNAVKVVALNGTDLASISHETFKKLSGLVVLRVQPETNTCSEADPSACNSGSSSSPHLLTISLTWLGISLFTSNVARTPA